MALSLKLKLFCTVFSFLSAFFLHAQNYRDKVYLKSGIAYEGMIVEQIPGKSIKLKTDNGVLVEIEYADIIRITKEEITANRTTGGDSSGETKGSVWRLVNYQFKGVDAGVAIGYFTGDAVGESVRVLVNYRVNKNFTLGLFLHQHLHNDKLTFGALNADYKNLNYLAFGLRSVYQLNSKSKTNQLFRPYIGTGIGFATTLATDNPSPVSSAGLPFNYYYEQGIFFNPFFGIEIPFNNRVSFYSEFCSYLNSWKRVRAVASFVSVEQAESGANLFNILVGTTVKFGKQ